jgi:membrane protein required for colicin V production
MIIDIIFLLLMLMACIKGYSKGLIVALFSIIGFIVGLAAALKLSAYAAEKLSSTFNTTGKWLPFISFLIVFLAVVILVNLGGKLVQKSVEMILLGWVNRIGGILLYAFLYSVLLSVFLFYAVQLHFLSAETITDSQVYGYLQPLGPKVINSLGNIVPIFKDMFGQLEEFFGKLPENTNAK